MTARSQGGLPPIELPLSARATVLIALLRGPASVTEIASLIEEASGGIVHVDGDRVRPAIWSLVADGMVSACQGDGPHHLTAEGQTLADRVRIGLSKIVLGEAGSIVARAAERLDASKPKAPERAPRVDGHGRRARRKAGP